MVELVEESTSYDTPYIYILYSIKVDGITIGDCTIAVDDVAFCERIDIMPQYRNYGYGTATMRLLSDKFDTIVVAPDNEDAARLFRAIGEEYKDESAEYLEKGYGVFVI